MDRRGSTGVAPFKRLSLTFTHPPAPVPTRANPQPPTPQDLLRIRNYKDPSRVLIKPEGSSPFPFTYDYTMTVAQALTTIARERRLKDNTRYGLYYATASLWLEDNRAIETYDLDDKVSARLWARARVSQPTDVPDPLTVCVCVENLVLRTCLRSASCRARWSSRSSCCCRRSRRPRRSPSARSCRRVSARSSAWSGARSARTSTRSTACTLLRARRGCPTRATSRTSTLTAMYVAPDPASAARRALPHSCSCPQHVAPGPTCLPLSAPLWPCLILPCVPCLVPCERAQTKLEYRCRYRQYKVKVASKPDAPTIVVHADAASTSVELVNVIMLDEQSMNENSHVLAYEWNEIIPSDQRLMTLVPHVRPGLLSSAVAARDG